MKSPESNQNLRASLLTAMLLAVGTTVRSADAPVALKDIFEDHFLVGVALNCNVVTGTGGGR